MDQGGGVAHNSGPCAQAFSVGPSPNLGYFYPVIILWGPSSYEDSPSYYKLLHLCNNRFKGATHFHCVSPQCVSGERCPVSRVLSCRWFCWKGGRRKRHPSRQFFHCLFTDRWATKGNEFGGVGVGGGILGSSHECFVKSPESFRFQVCVFCPQSL